MTILAWQRGGQPGGRAVVLVHAWASDGPGDWASTGWVLGLDRAGCHVLVPDLPGHGESADVLIPPDAEPGRWTAQALLADLQRLGISNAAAVGYADGCITAGHLAVRAPDQVPRLVLVGCDDTQGLHGGAQLAAALRDETARVWDPEVSESIARARRDRRHHLPTLAHWAERLAWPAAPRLGALRTPVLLAAGSDDAARRQRLPRLAQLFHDARVVTVPGDRRQALASPELLASVSEFLTRSDPDPDPEPGQG